MCHCSLDPNSGGECFKPKPRYILSQSSARRRGHPMVVSHGEPFSDPSIPHRKFFVAETLHKSQNYTWHVWHVYGRFWKFCSMWQPQHLQASTEGIYQCPLYLYPIRTAGHNLRYWFDFNSNEFCAVKDGNSRATILYDLGGFEARSSEAGSCRWLSSCHKPQDDLWYPCLSLL